jgi:hypothetical protein
MNLKLKRHKFTDESTIGTLFVDDVSVCTLEDGKREHKVYGETCIPSGTYKLELRNEGGMNSRYAARYPNHKGMIWLRHVPLFEWIYIHVGNYPKDTLGCILVGMTEGDDFVGNSRQAYNLIYDTIADAIQSDDGCMITIED